MATTEAPVVNINDDDTRLITPDEVRRFEERLTRTLVFAELAEMHLSRLESAETMGRLGGWPDGFRVPVEAVAAYALLADSLEKEAERMLAWAKDMRNDAPFLFWVRGEGSEDAS